MSILPTHTPPKRDRKLASQPSSLSRTSIPRSFVTANTQQTEKPSSHDQVFFPTRKDSDASQMSQVGRAGSPHALSPVHFIHSSDMPTTPQAVRSPSTNFNFFAAPNPISVHAKNTIDVHKTLPPVVESIRAGWQQTCQSSAVVSGLLAAVAAQLFSYFRADDTYKNRVSSEAAKIAILALCYATIFLNVGATISAFVIIDKMGALTARAAQWREGPAITTYEGTEVRLLEIFGAGKTWKVLTLQWLITFYAGAACLATLLLTFAWLQEALVIGILLTILTGSTIVLPLASVLFGSRARS